MRAQLEKWVRSKKCYGYLFVVTTLALFWAKSSGFKFALPIAMTAAVYPVYLFDLSQGRRDLALLHALFWAALSSLLMMYFVRHDPALMARMVLNGVTYRDKMFRWILTGEGSEGNIRLFLPEHAKHFTLFCVSSLLSGGVWGLAFGSILLNYMNFYVASLSLKSSQPLFVCVLGWPIWSVFRAVGFVLCGVTLSEPLLSQLFRFRPDFRKSSRYFLWGFVCILIDGLLKMILAPFWRDLLRHFVSL